MALDCSAESVMALAVSFNGLSDGQIEEIIAYLLCQIANL